MKRGLQLYLLGNSSVANRNPESNRRLAEEEAGDRLRRQIHLRLAVWTQGTSLENDLFISPLLS
jgi:hypothetical protein